MSSLSIEEKVGQLFFIGIPGPEIDSVTERLLDEVQPGGICLFSRNIRELSQTRDLLDKLRTTLRREPLLSVDQEGGLVDRLRRIMTPMPPPSRLRSADDARRLGEIISETLAILGFNMDFAPVVDVVDEERSGYSNGLRERNLGHSPAEVAEMAAAFVDGLHAFGILGCLKHFPGLGAADVDSHEELPSIGLTDEDLLACDLVPYQSLFSTQRVDAVMVAHAAYPASSLQEIGQNGKLVPSSLSKRFINDLLRGELSYNGLVITDDLEMGAILRNFGIAEACKAAITAGADMLAICADQDRVLDGYRSLLTAVKRGDIAEETVDRSIGRIEATRERFAPLVPFDAARLDDISAEIRTFEQVLG